MKPLAILLTCLPLAANAQSHAGHDMHENYKETSLGGLAVNVPNC